MIRVNEESTLLDIVDSLGLYDEISTTTKDGYEIDTWIGFQSDIGKFMIIQVDTPQKTVFHCTDIQSDWELNNTKNRLISKLRLR